MSTGKPAESEAQNTFVTFPHW